MRLPVQVQGIILCKENNTFSFLVLKRSEKRGGFWQPVTGGVEEGESLRACVLRELEEETGITKVKKFIDIDFRFQFKVDDDYWKETWLTEFVYVIELESKVVPTLSDEHTEYKWVDLNDALKLFKYDTTKIAFEKAVINLSK